MGESTTYWFCIRCLRHKIMPPALRSLEESGEPVHGSDVCPECRSRRTPRRLERTAAPLEDLFKRARATWALAEGGPLECIAQSENDNHYLLFEGPRLIGFLTYDPSPSIFILLKLIHIDPERKQAKAGGFLLDRFISDMCIERRGHDVICTIVSNTPDVVEDMICKRGFTTSEAEDAWTLELSSLKNYRDSE